MKQKTHLVRVLQRKQQPGEAIGARRKVKALHRVLRHAQQDRAVGKVVQARGVRLGKCVDPSNKDRLVHFSGEEEEKRERWLRFTP